MISLIAAVAKNWVIGNKGKIPWHLPDDLIRFKKITLGHIVLMGRKTFESILDYLGGPLPGRKNVVVTRRAGYEAPEGVEVFDDIGVALERYKDKEVFVIGGAEIYKQTIGLSDKLYITWVGRESEGDAFFPEIDFDKWEEVLREDGEGYSFVEYEKLSNP